MNAVDSCTLNDSWNITCSMATPTGLSSPTIPVSFTCQSARTGNGRSIGASR